MTNLSQLAAADKLTLAIAEVQGLVTVKRLPTQKPKKAYLTANRVGGASTRWHNSTGGNGRLKAGQLRPDEIALKGALRR